jgi:SpoVK/Ycf46/Vps4 family AAA+-type ATPase
MIFPPYPPELLRKGRFDEIFYVDFPNLKEREGIFSIHLESVIKMKPLI